MLKLINKFFPDWMTIKPGEWSEYPLELVSAGTKKFYANLYREPAKNEEYANTLTLQIQQGDDVIFCSKIDVPYVEFLECFGNEMFSLDVYDANGKEFKGDVPDDYLVVDVIRRGDTFEVTVVPPAKPAKREFFVDTPLGKLRVYSKRDIDDPNDFPGVYVDLITPAAPQGDMLAVVEYESCDENLQTCVYQPAIDEPEVVVVHESPNLGRIETNDTGILHYFDKNGNEILHGMLVEFDDGTIELVYRTESGELGVDATNKTLIENGKAAPCEYGIYPFSEFDLQEIAVVEKGGADND